MRLYINLQVLKFNQINCVIVVTNVAYNRTYVVAKNDAVCYGENDNDEATF